MASVRIRAARLDDAAVIIGFNVALAAETEHRELDRRILDSGVHALLRDATLGRYFVAEADSAIVGQIMLTQEWSDWRNGMFWWIQSVYVQPDWRRRGVFNALFRHVERLSRDDSAVCGLRLYVEQENTRAQAVYRECGLTLTNYRIMEFDRSRIEANPTEPGDG